MLPQASSFYKLQVLGLCLSCQRPDAWDKTSGCSCQEGYLIVKSAMWQRCTHLGIRDPAMLCNLGVAYSENLCLWICLWTVTASLPIELLPTPIGVGKIHSFLPLAARREDSVHPDRKDRICISAGQHKMWRMSTLFCEVAMTYIPPSKLVIPDLFSTLTLLQVLPLLHVQCCV